MTAPSAAWLAPWSRRWSWCCRPRWCWSSSGTCCCWPASASAGRGAWPGWRAEMAVWAGLWKRRRRRLHRHWWPAKRSGSAKKKTCSIFWPSQKEGGFSRRLFLHFLRARRLAARIHLSSFTLLLSSRLGMQLGSEILADKFGPNSISRSEKVLNGVPLSPGDSKRLST